MSFISAEFGLFLLAVFTLYYLPIKNAAYQNIVLAVASIFFVFLYDNTMIIVFAATVLITYFAGRMIQKSNKKKIVLAVFVCLDLSILLLLKYSPFLLLGISFYTLALIGYLLDVYRGHIEAEKNIIKFAVFASYFPHILQGPIARYDAFTNQLYKYRKFDYDRMVSSFQLILWGYMKKMVIADRAAIFVDSVYANDFTGDGTIAFVASLLYTVQIYADFSGCVDIAVGVSRFLGINLMENFDVPYMSASIKEFWKRWHISLSSWFRDYIYIPLGGNRRGSFRKWLNVFVVFLISGFWHGSGMNFIVWGLLHGIYQIIGNFWTPTKEKLNIKLTKMGGWNQHSFDLFITFNLVNIAWIFFRSGSVTKAFEMIKTILTSQRISVLFDGTLYDYGLSEKSFSVLIIFIVILVIVDVCKYRSVNVGLWVRQRFILYRWCIWMVGILSVLVLGIYGVGYDASEFIYMKF